LTLHFFFSILSHRVLLLTSLFLSIYLFRCLEVRGLQQSLTDILTPKKKHHHRRSNSNIGNNGDQRRFASSGSSISPQTRTTFFSSSSSSSSNPRQGDYDAKEQQVEKEEDQGSADGAKESSSSSSSSSTPVSIGGGVDSGEGSPPLQPSSSWRAPLDSAYDDPYSPPASAQAVDALQVSSSCAHS
jgi:hypothetical protein